MIKGLSVNSNSGYKINKRKIHAVVKELRTGLNFTVKSLAINFVTQENILEINKQYLNHNYTTDIITFDYSEEKYKLDSDIFISAVDAFENAKIFRVDKNVEIVRLIIHGILHLLGYDDIKKKDKIKMKSVEDDLVKKYKKLSKGIII